MTHERPSGGCTRRCYVLKDDIEFCWGIHEGGKSEGLVATACELNKETNPVYLMSQKGRAEKSGEKLTETRDCIVYVCVERNKLVSQRSADFPRARSTALMLLVRLCYS